MCPSPEKPTFENAIDQLQIAVKKLESGELSLEDSLKYFEHGIELSRLCQEHLSAAEQKVEILSKTVAASSGESPSFIV